MYFVDGTQPPPHIVTKFLEIIETCPGAIAVHCKGMKASFISTN